MAGKLRTMIQVRPWTITYIAAIVTAVLVLQVLEYAR